MDYLKGNETLKELKSMIKSNEIFSNIKTSGKGRTKAKIIKEMNEIITKYNNIKSKKKTSKKRKMISNESPPSKRRRISQTIQQSEISEKIQEYKCKYIEYIKYGFFSETVICNNIIIKTEEINQNNVMFVEI